MPAVSSTVGICASAAGAAIAMVSIATAAADVFTRGFTALEIKKAGAGALPCRSPRANLLLHLVFLGFLLLLGSLLALLALVGLLHLFLLFHRLGADMRRRNGKAARQRERRGHQDGDQLPHVFPLREVKEQVVTSPLLRNQSPPLTPCLGRG